MVTSAPFSYSSLTRSNTRGAGQQVVGIKGHYHAVWVAAKAGYGLPHVPHQSPALPVPDKRHPVAVRSEERPGIVAEPVGRRVVNDDGPPTPVWSGRGPSGNSASTARGQCSGRKSGICTAPPASARPSRSKIPEGQRKPAWRAGTKPCSIRSTTLNSVPVSLFQSLGT